MTRSTDIAPLLVRPGQSEIGFRKGTVLAWDPFTGHNTIQIGTEQFTDLPTLSASSVTFGVGDIVGILRQGNSFLVLGRINAVDNQHGNYLTAGLMGPADTQTNLWPSTTSTSLTDLWAGWVRRSSTALAFYMRTLVEASTTGEFSFWIDGEQVSASGTYTSGIGEYTAEIDWPASAAYNNAHIVTIKARRLSGSGKLAASLQGLFMT